MKTSTQSLLIALVTTAAAMSAQAHHSFAMFDRSKKETISGTIRDFDWRNPHIYFWVFVPKTDGSEEVWGIEGGSPNLLMQRGWSKTSFKPGEKVTLEIHPLKDGRPGGSFMKVTRADGTSMGEGGGAPAE